MAVVVAGRIPYRERVRIPLDDPAEENPQYTINARNIGDLAVAARASWKTYLQSASGPCDDTVHT